MVDFFFSWICGLSLDALRGNTNILKTCSASLSALQQMENRYINFIPSSAKTLQNSSLVLYLCLQTFFYTSESEN